MAEFQELIKSSDRIRNYTCQFYVHRFKTGNDSSEESARAYSNGHRRIESWLSRYIKPDYTSRGKHVYINVDNKTIPQNPLYTAWKSKSFTDNDLVFHFPILGLLRDCPKDVSSDTVTDLTSHNCKIVSDAQTVRLKLRECETLGILVSHKDGKALSYALAPFMPMETEPQCVNSDDMEPDGTEGKEQNLWQCPMTTMKYFQETAPFGCTSGTILGRQDEYNDLFQFKHHFIVRTPEDDILVDILTAVREKRMAWFENKSSRNGQVSILLEVPLKIFVSTQTGCKYLCLYLSEHRRSSNSRLDSIARVTLPEPCTFYKEVLYDLEKSKGKC